MQYFNKLKRVTFNLYDYDFIRKRMTNWELLHQINALLPVLHQYAAQIPSPLPNFFYIQSVSQHFPVSSEGPLQPLPVSITPEASLFNVLPFAFQVLISLLLVLPFWAIFSASLSTEYFRNINQAEYGGTDL